MLQRINHYELISRLNSIVTQGNRTKPDEFEFNKDAGIVSMQSRAFGQFINILTSEKQKERILE